MLLLAPFGRSAAMTDVDSMVMSLRLAWLKRLFGGNDGGFFFFKCNYDIRDYPNLLNFIPNFCNGGLNSEKCLHLKRIGFT